MLRLNNVEVIYDDVILVLKGLSLEVPDGKIITLLGANGAGKSTTLKAISGLLMPEKGKVTQGSIEFDGVRIDGRYPEDVCKLGIFQVMEGRRVFDELTVEENLKVGAHTRTDRSTLAEDFDLVFEYFPPLRQRRTHIAGYLSGGEQQMLVIGRALVAKPRLLLLDEPSLGLAPLLVQEIFEIIKRINEQEGVTILLVEQNANVAMNIADYGYIMENGKIVLDAPVEQLKANEDVKEFYLGLTSVGQRKSFREVKHYKRRKRWIA